MGYIDLNEQRRQRKLNIINNIATIAVFIITIINILIAGFGINSHAFHKWQTSPLSLRRQYTNRPSRDHFNLLTTGYRANYQPATVPPLKLLIYSLSLSPPDAAFECSDNTHVIAEYTSLPSFILARCVRETKCFSTTRHNKSHNMHFIETKEKLTVCSSERGKQFAPLSNSFTRVTRWLESRVKQLPML